MQVRQLCRWQTGLKTACEISQSKNGIYTKKMGPVTRVTGPIIKRTKLKSRSELVAKGCKDLTAIVVITVTDCDIVDGEYFAAVYKRRVSVKDVINAYQ
jgi:hypothetical protein